MQTFVDPSSPRFQLAPERLPRGVVSFPAHLVDSVASERARFAPDVYTEDYARKSLEYQTLLWYYEGLPVAYRSLPDGIDVLAVGWTETAELGSRSDDTTIKVVQP